MCAYDAAGWLTVRTGHKACRYSLDRGMLSELSERYVFFFSSASPSPVLSKVSTDVCTEPFLVWNRSDTFADNCPIVTARCILTKAAYLFRLHLLKRQVYMYTAFSWLSYATFSNFFMTEKMKTAETRHTPTNTPHTIHRGISPQIHAATAVK